MPLGDSCEDVLSGFAWAGGGLEWNSQSGVLLFVHRSGMKCEQEVVPARTDISEGISL